MPNITLPLGDFLDILFGYKDHIEIDANLAELISFLDKNEVWVHIEPSRPGQSPVIWRIASWRTEYTKWLRDKERSEVERQALFAKKELIVRVAKAIMNLTGNDPELANLAASRIVERNDTRAINNLLKL